MNELFTKLELELRHYLPKFFKEQSEHIASAGDVFCLRLFFYDSHAPSFYLSVRVVSIADRDTIKETERAVDLPYCLFHPGERAGFELKKTIPENPESEPKTALEKICAEIYTLNVPEHEKMVSLRACLHRVCRHLNQEKEHLPFPMGYGFSISPADGSNYFDDFPEIDIAQSVSLNELSELLESRYISFRGIRYQIDENNSFIKWNDAWKKN